MSSGALEALVRIGGDALTPLTTRLRGELANDTLEQLGLRLPPSVLGGAGPKLEAAAVACGQLPDAVGALVTATQGSDDGALISAALRLAEIVVRAGVAFAELGVALNNGVSGAAGLTAAQRTRLTETIDKLPERLAHLMLVSWVEDKQPNVKGALELIGLFDEVPMPSDPGDSSLAGHRRTQVRFDRIPQLFSDPSALLKSLYHFGDTGFDGKELFRRIKAMVDRPDAEAILIEAPGQPPVLEVFKFRLAVAPGPPGTIPGLRLRLRIPAQKDLAVSVPISGPWAVTVDSKSRFEGGLELLVHPVNGIRIEPPAATASVELALGIKAERPGGAPMIIVGQAGGSRLELRKFAAKVPLKLSASTAGASPTVAFGAEAELVGGKLVIDASRADGFLATILGGLRVESGFDLGAAFDTEKGFRFVGSATIEIAIPTHLSLGPVEISRLYLIGGFKDGAIPLEFSTDIGLKLGPIAASVARMGAIAKITFPARGGNAGPAQVDVSFKPPNGIGLSVDAGVVKGGGYLYLDFEREEYAGALELVFSEWIALRAIGLITTRMPDGSKGFSMLIIITVEFGSGIQLGFGFTLIGVGGIIGINRVVNIDALAQGVVTGGVESVMFPHDIIANAPRILSDLRTYFPVAQDRFLIGPMAKIGWGTPTLLSVSLGIIIEIPSINITILGVIKVVLPDEQADVLRLQVNFIGRLEPSNKLLWFYAELYDSRVLFMTLEGGMGLLVNWGEQANFVVSVGGFHPRYTPPPLPFPSPPRLAINILNESYARVRVEAYFAVTSNSVQFGAHAELFFGVSAFNIEGHFGFDALFQFDPFFFSFGLSLSLSVKVFGIGLFSVGFSGLLEGPTPWHIEGKGSISLLFFDISVPFSHTWGEDKKATLDPIPVFPMLEGELGALTNWRAVLPKSNNLGVALRKLGDSSSDKLVLHPVGSLQISQRKVPLDLTIDKVGNQRPSDANHFTLAASLTGGGALGVSPLEEPFATGQFIQLSDAERLSKPGFSPQWSGVEIKASGEQFRTSQGVRRVIRYETIILDTNFRRFVKPFFIFFVTGISLLHEFLFRHFLAGAAVSKSALSQQQKKRMVPFEQVVAIKANEYSVAFNHDNTRISAAASFSSHEKADQHMKQQIQVDPSLADRVHVIPNTELEAA
jgi:hypothetical protein